MALAGPVAPTASLSCRLGLSCARPSLPVAATKRWWEMNGSEFMLAFHLLGCLHCDRALRVSQGDSPGLGPRYLAPVPPRRLPAEYSGNWPPPRQSV